MEPVFWTAYFVVAAIGLVVVAVWLTRWGRQERRNLHAQQRESDERWAQLMRMYEVVHGHPYQG